MIALLAGCTNHPRTPTYKSLVCDGRVIFTFDRGKQWLRFDENRSLYELRSGGGTEGTYAQKPNEICQVKDADEIKVEVYDIP